MTKENAVLPLSSRLLLRIGIHWGNVRIEDINVRGHEVNIASRIQSVARPGGVCLSSDAKRDVEYNSTYSFRSMGLQELKGVPEPKEVFHLILPWEDRDISSPTSPQVFPNASGSVFLSKIKNLIEELKRRDDSASATLAFQAEIIGKLTHQYDAEIRGVTDLNVTFPLNPSSRFLNTAIPLFDKATSIYAVSVDEVSEFWLSAMDRGNNNKYLSAQRKSGTGKTVRLFVFSSLESARGHISVLSNHLDCYPDVFYCSKETFKQLLRRWQHSEQLDKDFGVLDFQDENKSRHWIYASLDKTSHVFYDVTDDKSREGSSPCRFVADLEKWSEASSNHNWQIRIGSTHNPFYIYHYEGDPRDDDERGRRWVNSLKEMFEHDKKTDVIHLVFLKYFGSSRKKKILLEKCRQIEAKLLTQGEDRMQGLKAFWISVPPSRNNTSEPTDPEFCGRLSMRPDSQHEIVLVFRFENRSHLEDFYNHTEHSPLRREIYCALKPGLEERYKTLMAMKATNMDTSEDNERLEREIAKGFEDIEQEVADSIERCDYDVADNVYF